MSIATLILGQSGTGKSTSLRNLDPRNVLLIQVIKKPLPYRSPNWKYITPENKQGSILVSDNPQFIINVINGSKRPIIIIDDFQYVMANEFMRRSSEKSFDKFTEIGRNAWDVFNAAINAHDHKRVYLLSHTEEDAQGKTKIKTIGKMLDEKITLEGMVEKYDSDAKGRITKNCVVAPEVANQRIGFLLQRENYQNDNGEWKHQMNFFSCFHAQSELMAKEIIERKTTPEALPKSLASLMSNPITTRKPKNNNGGGYGGSNQGFNQNNGYNQGGFDGYYDDVPPVLGTNQQDDFPY